MGDKTMVRPTAPTHMEPIFERLSPNLQTALNLSDALVAGNDFEINRLMGKILCPPSVLRALQSSMGSEWIRLRNMRTDLADAEFGHDWLDR